MPQTTPTLNHVPLLSPKFVWKITAVVAVLCLVTLAITATGRMIGHSISRAGNTAETTLHEIVIGNDVLRLPANVIRFETQRVSGVQNAVDIYFAWPGMEGYSEAKRDIFNQTPAPSSRTTLPITWALSATKQNPSASFGALPSRL